MAYLEGELRCSPCKTATIIPPHTITTVPCGALFVGCVNLPFSPRMMYKLLARTHNGPMSLFLPMEYTSSAPICGLSIMSVTLWLQRAKGTSEIVGEGNFDINPYVAMNILIVVGAIIMILGFLGCCGAVSENRCVLLAFFIGLLLILTLQVAAGILSVSFRSKADHILSDILYENVRLLTATDDAAKVFQQAIVMFQEQFKCCGLITGPADWGNNFNEYFKSCECSQASGLCTTYQGKTVYKQPCIVCLEDIVTRRIQVIIGIAFGLAVVEVLGLVFSMILYCQIGKD
ncbi:PREDICTED: tetraspanin-8 [Condylura cristata]|uniref:tetraspanin-8 n=1 Tax=Condylura cristata TaxID=143302 RepID=UPI000334673D|nr:PREDICTED: tetraspanin-8 [Condylura cristata]